MKYTKDNPKLVDSLYDLRSTKSFTGVAKNKYNDIAYYLNGNYHREDGPAVEYFNGTKCWFLNGKPHREDGPAIEYLNGRKEWCLNGKLHREDGPAVEYANGEKRWFLNDKLYGENDKYTIESWIRFCKILLLI